jgi:hypothetical protein
MTHPLGWTTSVSSAWVTLKDLFIGATGSDICDRRPHRPADAVSAACRAPRRLFSGPFGQSGTLGATWESVAGWPPVGAVMTLSAGIFGVGQSTNALFGRVRRLIFASIRIGWFRW